MASDILTNSKINNDFTSILFINLLLNSSEYCKARSTCSTCMSYIINLIQHIRILIKHSEKFIKSDTINFFIDSLLDVGDKSSNTLLLKRPKKKPTIDETISNSTPTKANSI